MADLLPLCRVALRVALAVFGPIANRSERISAVIFVCRSVDTNVRCSGTSIPDPRGS